MVFWVVKPSLRLASCWRLEVVKGAAGYLRRSPFLMMDTRNVASRHASTTAWASCWLCSSALSPPKPVKRALTFALPMVKGAEMVQYSSGTKMSISSSRSQIIFVATDCTRPALRPFFTLRQSSGLIL